MKVFVYVADKDNPSNTRGLLVGWVYSEDSRDYTAEVKSFAFDKVIGFLGYLDGGIPIIEGIEGEDEEGMKIPCRLEMDPFPIPGAAEEKKK